MLTKSHSTNIHGNWVHLLGTNDVDFGCETFSYSFLYDREFGKTVITTIEAIQFNGIGNILIVYEFWNEKTLHYKFKIVQLICWHM